MSYSHHRRPSAFTLIELLVVIGIIAVLAGLFMPVLSSVRTKGKMMKEMNAARQIMAGYLAYAAANDGSLLPGYDKSVQKVVLPSGITLSGEMASRYPWRVAPYLNGQVEEIFLVNDTQKVTASMAHNGFDYQYRASLHPALGINAYGVGGYIDNPRSSAVQGDAVRRLGSAVKPSSMIVLASARMRASGKDEEVPGYFAVRPPLFGAQKWDDKFDRNRPAANFGNVDPRWDGKAMCAFLDGSVRLLDEAELKDMRHWSNTAAELNDPSYTLTR